MSTVSNKNKTFSATEEALTEVSKLLVRLAKSRKAGMRLQEIISLTGVTARLTRSLHGYGSDHSEGADDGYGDRNHFARISAMKDARNVVR